MAGEGSGTLLVLTTPADGKGLTTAEPYILVRIAPKPGSMLRADHDDFEVPMAQPRAVIQAPHSLPHFKENASALPELPQHPAAACRRQLGASVGETGVHLELAQVGRLPLLRLCAIWAFGQQRPRHDPCVADALDGNAVYDAAVLVMELQYLQGLSGTVLERSCNDCPTISSSLLLVAIAIHA